MKKILVLAMFYSVLTACNHEDDPPTKPPIPPIEDETPPIEDETPQPKKPSSGPSLSDITGVWDFTEDYGQDGTDELYIVIKPTGVWVDYDYDGDSYDQGSNCYYKEESRITDLGNGNFELVTDEGTFSFRAALSDNQLSLTAKGQTITIPRAPLRESDFSPLCEESLN